MSITTITATKADADSKLGFSYSATDAATIITAIAEGGLFENTPLKEGHEIITINGKSAQGIGSPAMTDLLASLPSGEVSIQVLEELATDKPDDEDGAIFEYIAAKIPKSAAKVICAKMKSDISDDMPKILQDANVPPEKWTLIYALVAGKILPLSVECIQMIEEYKVAPSQERGFLSVEGQRNQLFDPKESKVLKISMLHSNLALVALSVSGRVNAILKEYGVMAVVAYDSIDFRSKYQYNTLKIPTGFHFY